MSFSDIPLTSQTAQVDEYIILWTINKTQKNKKWHDGVLKYHTFNKRVMVYDGALHLVCSKFHMDPAPLSPGDELEFDEHLVTIEEIKGRTEQDIRSLFEKTAERRAEKKATPGRRMGLGIGLQTPATAKSNASNMSIPISVIPAPKPQWQIPTPNRTREGTRKTSKHTLIQNNASNSMAASPVKQQAWRAASASPSTSAVNPIASTAQTQTQHHEGQAQSRNPDGALTEFSMSVSINSSREELDSLLPPRFILDQENIRAALASMTKPTDQSYKTIQRAHAHSEHQATTPNLTSMAKPKTVMRQPSARSYLHSNTNATANRSETSQLPADQDFTPLPTRIITSKPPIKLRVNSDPRLSQIIDLNSSPDGTPDEAQPRRLPGFTTAKIVAKKPSKLLVPTLKPRPITREHNPLPFGTESSLSDYVPRPADKRIESGEPLAKKTIKRPSLVSAAPHQKKKPRFQNPHDVIALLCSPIETNTCFTDDEDEFEEFVPQSSPSK